MPSASESFSVSVCVTNYQGAAHLPHCLEALRAQTYPIDQLIVVDNASTDASLAVVREHSVDARVIELPVNAGPCPARNAGLEAARNDWVLLVDNDAVLEPDVLERLVAAAREHPQAALLQPRSVFADNPERVHYDGGAFHYVGLFSLRNFGLPLAEARVGRGGTGVVDVPGAVSVCLLARRRTLLDLGAFDPAYFVLFEDLDLSYRLRLARHSILSVEDALCLHRGGTSGISFRASEYPARRAFLHSRNRWRFLAVNYRLRTLLVALPGLILYELAWAVFCLFSGTLLAHLHGKLAFCGSLPDVLARRRAVQATRRGVCDRHLLIAGPLTLSPQLAGGLGPRVLSGLLALWWRAARILAG